MIESVQNPKVKKWSELLTKKGREKYSLFLIEGVRLVEEAIHSGASIEAVLWESGKTFSLIQNLDPRIEQWEVSKEISQKLSETEHSQGIFAVVRINKESSLEHIEDRNLLLLIDAVQDPGNLGTMIRSADAAGVDAVLLGNGTVDVFNPKTVRSTMGSIFHLPILTTHLVEMIPRLKEKGYTVFAATLDTEHYYHEITYPEKTCMIVGNEGNGISLEVLSLVDQRVKIPIYGKAESLNVAIATSLLLYEIRRTGR